MISKVFALKPALLGVICLLCAILVAWFSPKKGINSLGDSAKEEEATQVLKTKTRERDSLTKREMKNVQEEYLRKAKRGMTEDEVRWMAADFVALGLHVEHPQEQNIETYMALRKAREEWYLGALVSGLMLADEQEMEARQKINALRERDYANFLTYLYQLKSFNQDGRQVALIDLEKAKSLINPNLWLNGQGYSPRELCQLSDQQLALTRFDQGEKKTESYKKFRDSLNLRSKKEIPDVSSDSLELELEFGEMVSLVGFEFVTVSYRLPFTRRQMDALSDVTHSSSPEDPYFFQTLMLLQPDQLKLYFLFHPHRAKLIAR